MTDTARPATPLPAALPFWLSLSMLPMLAAGAIWGGWHVVMPVIWAVVLLPILDLLAGQRAENPDPDAPHDLTWYRAITLIWPPVQLAAIFGALAWVAATDHLSGWELAALFYAVGLTTGAIGITYAHELMHQKSAVERWWGDILMASVLYGHFRSEHLRVHHLWVATPRDPVTARYNEGFWRFYLRVLATCPGSAWRAEVTLLARAGRPWWHRTNPFWRYAALQAAFVALAWALAGGLGVALFVWQAFVAVTYLELTNYIEHYGLTRRHLGEGRYEPVRPHHSWNAAHRVSNWLLINLQRHSDHHFKPDRRFPLLQTYDAGTAPQLPGGYPLMVAAAAVPPVWRRLMNPRVRAWRRQFYPDITDWSASKAGTTPAPRGG